MDSETLFWLLILGAPVLSRLLRGKKKQKQKRQPVPRQVPPAREKSDRKPTPFEEALRQIQEALTESQRPAPAPPAPEQLPPKPTRLPPKPTRLPPKPTRLPQRQAPPQEFHAQETFTKPTHFFDEPFDKEAPFTAPGRDEHYHQPLTGDAEAPKGVRMPKPSKKLSKWQQTITNIALLGPPRSRRPWSDPSRR